MPSLEYLNWDSDFFGRKIGKCEFQTPEDVLTAPNVLAEAQSQQYALVYLFTPENQRLPDTVKYHFDAKRIDTRLVYTRDIDNSLAYDNPNMHTYQSTDDINQLYRLAYEGGQHSRYKLDTRFSDEEYSRLYQQWMENSLNGSIADKVFVYKDAAKIVGMITLRITGDVGLPGIMATDRTYRGKGIGTAYFKHMLAYLLENKVPRVQFITQKSNQTACRIYHKTNCQLISATDIYHVWL